MKTLYLDIFSGISGDMFLGALIDLGVDFHYLEQELARLGLEDYHLHVSRGQKASITGTKFEVHLAANHHHADEHEHEHEHEHGHGHAHPHHHEHGHEHGEDEEDEHEHGHDHTHHHLHTHEHDEEHSHHQGEEGEHEHAHEHEYEHEPDGSRTFAQIKQLIGSSPFSDWVKSKATAVFQRIALAEGKIHGCPTEAVHFHEVGAIDSIMDIVGACLALETLGKPRVLALPVVEGSGWVHCAHGRFPIPAPATLEILGARGIALSQCDEPHELVTPTGAGLLAEFVESFGPMPGLIATNIGYGLGSRDHQTRPNVLRAILSDSSSGAHDWETDTIAVLETNLDNLNGEILGHFVETALTAGALDVFHTPIQMKKNRPGVLLTVLCEAAQADRFSELMLRETSAFGVRRSYTERRKLQREFQTVETPYGAVMVKLGKLDGQVLHAAPEFEDCKRLAAQAGVTLKQVYEAAHRTAGGFPG